MKRIFTLTAILAVVMLGFAAPAAATDDKNVREGAPTIEYDKGECGEADFTVDGELVVSSETITAGFVVRVDGGAPDVFRGGLASTNGTHPFHVETSVGPFVSTAESVTIEYRVFGGPVREDDNPAWNTADHPDWVDTVVALEEAEERFWQAYDEGPFVTWHTLEVEPCPVEVAPTEPTVTDKTCDDVATITLNDDEGVLWSINDEGVEPGTSQAAPGHHEIVATPAKGYTFGDEESEMWPRDIFGPKDPCPGPTGPKGDTGDDGKTPILDDVTPASSTGESLPKTGAPGSLALATGAGLLLMLGTALVLIGRKRAAARR